MIHVISGVYYLGKRRVACRNDYCTACKRMTFAEGIRPFVIGHIYWVPLFPLGWRRYWYCSLCHHETDERRPTRPLIMWLALGTALLVLAIGVGAWLDWSTEGIVPGIATGIGLVAACVFGLTRSRHDAYSKARRSVVPLSREQCPYCKGPLLPKRIPHCYTCNIDIF